MKKCHYCAEEIQDEAIKCKHCGSMLAEVPKEKWYFRPSALVVAFLSVGPFMLPLVWFNPRFNHTAKIIISAVIIILSYLLWVILFSSFQNISTYYKTMFQGNFSFLPQSMEINLKIYG